MPEASGLAACQLGQSVTIMVQATGLGPLLYQWYLNGNNIPGANYPSFFIPAVTVSNLGIYPVEVRNATGAVPSQPRQTTR